MVLNMHTTKNVMTLARLAAIVVAFLFVHDAMMAMAPHGVEVESHHELTIEGQNCGSTEGVARSIPALPLEPTSAAITRSDFGLVFDSSISIPIEPIHIGPDSSAIRIWQQVFLN